MGIRFPVYIFCIPIADAGDRRSDDAHVYRAGYSAPQPHPGSFLQLWNRQYTRLRCGGGSSRGRSLNRFFSGGWYDVFFLGSNSVQSVADGPAMVLVVALSFVFALSPVL